MIRLFETGKNSMEEILARDAAEEARVDGVIEEVFTAVKTRGDRALLEYTLKFDGAALSSLAVSKEELESAVREADADFIASLRACAQNIEAFHRLQTRTDFISEKKAGMILGQRILPLERVGIYVPGGRASYPSTVLMNAIPAKIAGVKEIVMVTPPKKDGTIDKNILAAAAVAGVTEIYKLGGAQAIAALALGAESVGRVDKIVGPGNIYVARAKARAYGMVSIDMIAGPSEILIIADHLAQPRYLAADLLSQAEHDPLAASILLTDSAQLASMVREELERQLPLLPKGSICRESIDRNGKIIVTEGIEQAVKIANLIAPEHMELAVQDPFALLPEIKNAGSVFLGQNAPEPLGDYYAGPNHTLPTGGTARFSSPLSVDDFIKKSSFIYYTRQALKDAAPDIIRFAETEGLSAHARSVAIRFEEEQE